MREIKFRGMGIDGKFHYGNLAVLTKKLDHVEAGTYISNSVGVPFAYQVRPETVGEFTGKKTYDGKEIYEGDIVKHNQFEQGKESQGESINGVVMFYNGSFYISAKGRFSTIYLHDIDGNGSINRCWHGHNNLPDIYEGANDFEIIGNIYSNPELKP